MTSLIIKHSQIIQSQEIKLIFEINQLSLDQYLMKLIRNLTRRALFNFSEQKKPEPNKPRGIRNFLRGKLLQEKFDIKTMSSQEQQDYYLSHRMLYIPYAPVVLIALPALYFFSVPTDPMFLKSINILQYYTSGILCFNTFFNQENVKKYLPFLIGLGLANCLSGPLSLASPGIIALLSIYFPFTNEKYQKIESEEQRQKYKVYLHSQMLFYFMIVITMTLKCYHYVMVTQLQKKIESYDKENLDHFSASKQE